MLAGLFSSARACRGPTVRRFIPRNTLGQIYRNGGSRFHHSRYAYQRFDNRQRKSFLELMTDATSRRFLAITFGGGLLFYYTHLEEAPISGRKRFIWVPRSLELKLGEYTYSEILQQTQGSILPQDHRLTRRVKRIFGGIVEAAYNDPTVDKSLLEGIEWEVHIVYEPRAPPNAFVLPGGKVFVFSNILGICENDDGLATVLSHEFAHQLARHTAENLSKAPFYAFMNLLLYAITGVEGLNGLLTDSLLRMPASRQMETEADYIGLMIMARACYRPGEAVHLWHRMAEFEKRSTGGGGGNFEFLSTHPASERRIENMKKWLPRASDVYSQSECHGTFSDYFREFQDTFFGSPFMTLFFN